MVEAEIERGRDGSREKRGDGGKRKKYSVQTDLPASSGGALSMWFQSLLSDLEKHIHYLAKTSTPSFLRTMMIHGTE